MKILQAYRGTIFSWQHKGSSYYLPQNTKPIGKESMIEKNIYVDFMKDTSGENTPSGDIDLMKYYNGPGNLNRTIASEDDVLGLIWLTKIEIK